MDYQLITVDVADGVGTLTFNRPDRMNALNQPILSEINDALTHLKKDEAVRVLVLTGAGRGFCAGADLSGAGAGDAVAVDGTVSRHMQKMPFTGFGEFAHNLYSFEKPTIAAVNGACVGAGLAFASACDFRISSDQARYSAIFVQRALVPDCGITYYLPKIIGLQRALEMTMTGKMYSAEEALAMGLVNKVVPHESLMDAVREQAKWFATGPSVAIELAKRGIHRSFGSDLASCLEYEAYAQNVCFNSEDLKEGRNAFFEKREPHFTGR